MRLIKYPYLSDSAFLEEVDCQLLKTCYTKILALDKYENILEDVTAYISSGNINITSTSSIRRTANLTLTIDDPFVDNNILENFFSINKRVAIDLGYENNTNKYQDYPILWFPQGIFIITKASVSVDISGIATVSIELKDKMCLLNGEVGGTIPALTTLHQYDTYDPVKGEYFVSQPTIYQIIQELVNHFGGEPLNNIIISDISEYIKQSRAWNSISPLYLYEDGYSFVPRDTKKDIPYKKGNNVGYIYTKFTYPGELIADAGNSIVDILEKIKNTLGNYEYFYDVYGMFHFQEIKNYLNTSKSTQEWKNIISGSYEEKDNFIYKTMSDKAVYSFNDNKLFSSITNSPQYGNIKNDFIIYGLRKNGDIQIPIRYHLAIDSRPMQTIKYDGLVLYKDEFGNEKAIKPQPKPSSGVGVEGYYYIDEDEKIYYWDASVNSFVEDTTAKIGEITSNDYRTNLYLAGVEADLLGTSSNDYYAELKHEWPKLYNLSEQKFKDDVVNNNGNAVDYFLDLVGEEDLIIFKYSIGNIGRRTKVIKDDSINCIFEPEVPDVVFVRENEKELMEICNQNIQKYIVLEDAAYNMLIGGVPYNSAYEAIRASLYEYVSLNENITVTSMPVYYLEPNIRISVTDEKTGIEGDYIINTISYSFDGKSMMNLNCSRAVDRI